MNEKRMFRKLVLAGIRQDMANRIMYSILPSLADPAQVALTGGAIDYKALAKAAAGRESVITEGIALVKKELKHYQGDKSKVDSIIFLLSSKNYDDALSKAIDLFSEESSWDNFYGGRPWENIARTVRQLYRYSVALDQAKQSGEKEKEIDLMKKIIVELNVFDGLSHNSSSVINNIINNQFKPDPNVESWINDDEKEKEINRTRRIMNSKELEDSDEVFKQIEKTLIDSGDLNQYKDWVTKLRSRPSYRKFNPETGLKLAKISIKKTIIPMMAKINSYKDRLKKEKSLNYQAAIREMISYCNFVESTLFNDMINFSENYKDIPNIEVGNKYYKNIHANFQKIAEQLSELYSHLPLSKDNSEKDKLIEKIITLSNSAVFFLDSLL